MRELAELGLGWREGIIALLVLVALYISYVLVRMRRLSAPPRRAEPDTEAAQDSRVTSSTETEDDESAEEDVTYRRPVAPPPDSVWQAQNAAIAEAMLRRDLEDQIEQLREELDAVRGELAALRGELQQEMAHVRAAQTISPIYGDAMQMAAAGYDASVIAERCGIARAEAELVVAMANSQSSQ